MIRHLLLIPIALLAMQLSAQTSTWSSDVACIVYTHCTPCHRTDGPAHFELLTYADAYYWRNEMMAATETRFMPPWPPDPNYRSLAHERVLTQGEIDVIANWVNAGAPEGDPSQAPDPPQFNGNAVITDPDLSEVMEDFTIPSSTQDLYRCFVLQIDNPTNRFITGMEIIPGNSNMVHHVLVFQDTTGQAQQLDAQDPSPGYTNFGGIGVNEAKLIGAWVPGEQPFFTPPGMGIQLFAGADIVMQIHYPATSEVEVDSTRINLQFSDAPFLRPLGIDAVLDHGWTLTNGPLIIPPNEVKTFYNEFTVPFNSTITSIAPHAHLVCTSMKAYAVLPGGETIPLIDIPNWDFRWQGHYSFRNPIYLPQGTVLHGEATYDNTANNPFNPNDPPQWVFLGESTTNEMMLFYFAWTPGIPSDVNIVIDDSEHMQHHEDCVPLLLTGLEESTTVNFEVAPIPARDRLRLTTEASAGTVAVIDPSGKIVLQQRINGTAEIDVQSLARGFYTIEFRSDHGMARRKIVLE
jgi:hypothetical protein